MGRKHQPVRRCVACREAFPKRELVRLVRDGDGRVDVDPTGKKNGRGAYLCRRSPCWDRALERGILRHALRVDLDPETVERLRRAGAQLASDAMEP